MYDQTAYVVVAAALAVLGLACRNAICTSGETQPCFCTGGMSGAQSCPASGGSWDQCICDHPAGGAATTSGDSPDETPPGDLDTTTTTTTSNTQELDSSSGELLPGECRFACETPADCVNCGGPPDFCPEEFWECAGGLCEFVGCTSDRDCEDAGGAGEPLPGTEPAVYACVPEVDSGVPNCLITCDGDADCYGMDACIDGACQTYFAPCVSDADCNALLDPNPGVCRPDGSCRFRCESDADCLTIGFVVGACEENGCESVCFSDADCGEIEGLQFECVAP